MVSSFIAAASEKLGRQATIDDVLMVDMPGKMIHRLSRLWVTCDARYAYGGLHVYAGPLNDESFRECPECQSSLPANSEPR